MQTGDSRHSQSGYAYLLLLLGIAVMGAASSAAVEIGATEARRDAERHLLTIGNDFQQALLDHAAAPKELGHLLKDNRTPGVKRHLRRVPIDPLTGRDNWGLVRDGQGGIVGVYSLAKGTPIQRTGFESRWAHFEQASSYQAWVFGKRAMLLAPQMLPRDAQRGNTPVPQLR